MAEIINLRRARKAKAKAEKDNTAEANRVLHGTPKAVRNLAKAAADKADQALASHRLEKPRSVGASRSDQEEDEN
jgi:hypothetical protein